VPKSEMSHIFLVTRLRRFQKKREWSGVEEGFGSRKKSRN
jgi:hypothetical protein